MKAQSQTNNLLIGRKTPGVNLTGGRALGRVTTALSTACEISRRGSGRTMSGYAVVAAAGADRRRSMASGRGSLQITLATGRRRG